jgi:uncharacterized membrane protein
MFLFSVVLLPFTSGLLGEYASETQLHLPYGIYVVNICLTALMNAILWFYVSNPKHQILTHEISKERILLGFYFTLVVPILFVISFLVSLYDPTIGRLIPILIPIVLKYGLAGLTKRAFANEEKQNHLNSTSDSH